MRASKVHAIKRALDIPRKPRAMGPATRKWWRQLKRRYSRLPAPARAVFLTNITTFQSELNKLQTA